MVIVGRLRRLCRAVFTPTAEDAEVADVQTVDAALRRGRRTCHSCGSRNVPVSQALRGGRPVQAWRYGTHFPPVSRR
jgi:hypothetical protein